MSIIRDGENCNDNGQYLSGGSKLKKDAKIADKFKDFKPNLSDRRNIILGMGLRGFEKLFSLKNKSILFLIGIVYLWTFAFYLLLGEDSYPCNTVSEELKTCTHLNFYGDLQYGGTRIFLVLIAAVASSGLIANDLTDKSIHLYLSRPISRIDYLIARIIPIFLLMLTITLIPNLVVFISQFSKSGLDVDFLSSNMWTLSNLILQAIFYSISYSIIGITFSAAINRESLASAGFFGTVYGVSLIVEIFYGLMSEMDIENSEYILLLSIIHFLDIISYKIFNVDYFVTIFGSPEIIEFPLSIIIGLYLSLIHI